jgi:hypothetical protein
VFLFEILFRPPECLDKIHEISSGVFIGGNKGILIIIIVQSCGARHKAMAQVFEGKKKKHDFQSSFALTASPARS